VQTIFTLSVIGIGWGLGYFVGGGHEWGWRGGVLGALFVIGVAVRLRNEVSGVYPPAK
jgi:hypothetical protein